MSKSRDAKARNLARKQVPNTGSTVSITLGEVFESATGQAPFQHIHGAMRLEIGGRVVPYMGYLGPNDVCLNNWIGELQGVIEAFKQGKTEYVFDEGEQGQPAYRFEHEGDVVYLSIVQSARTDATADPRFQRVAFQYRDLEPALHAFGQALLERIRRVAPSQEAYWARRLTPKR
jgi:hypothetical protein